LFPLVLGRGLLPRLWVQGTPPLGRASRGEVVGVWVVEFRKKLQNQARGQTNLQPRTTERGDSGAGSINTPKGIAERAPLRVGWSAGKWAKVPRAVVRVVVWGLGGLGLGGGSGGLMVWRSGGVSPPLRSRPLPPPQLDKAACRGGTRSLVSSGTNCAAPLPPKRI
jgi:hypothetical protein